MAGKVRKRISRYANAPVRNKKAVGVSRASLRAAQYRISHRAPRLRKVTILYSQPQPASKKQAAPRDIPVDPFDKMSPMWALPPLSPRRKKRVSRR